MDYDIDPEAYADGLRVALEGGSDCDIEQVCTEINSLYLVRKMLGVAHRISSSIADGQPADELVVQTDEALRKLTGEAVGESTVKNIDEMIQASPNGFDELINPPMDGIGSPWPSLNEYIYGFRPGQMYVLGARPGVGKTAALIQIADYAASCRNVVAFFSHEMDSFDIWSRILCSRGGIRSSDFMHRELKLEDKNKINEYIKHVAPRTLLISDKGGRTPLTLRSEIARIKAKYGKVDMVCVDYLQLMESPTHSRDRVQEVGAISRALKRIAMEFKTRVIVAAQLNRMVDNRPGDTRPKLSDLRESGSIEQDADLCMFLHRPSMYKKAKEGFPDPPDEFIIEKHRRGRTGIINMEYVGEHFKYIEKIGK
jgi:replicative DNA helicase